MADNTDTGKAILQHAREVFFGGQAAGTSLDVFIQDQTTQPVQYFLMNEQKDDILLVSGTAIDDTVLYVNAGHGFTAGGEYMTIREGQAFSQTLVTNVSGDDITIANPLANPYTTDASVIRGVVDMNISGSVSAEYYTMTIDGETPLDIQTVIITMQHPAAGDDSKFGDVTALTKGLFFSKVNSEHQHLGLYKQNQDFREFGADIEYQEKAGGGNHSTNVTFDIKKVYGVVIRIDPREDDVLKALVQDDLNDLLRLRVSVMGQFTQGE